MASQERLPIGFQQFLCLELVNAVEYFNKVDGKSHGDLKPDNIIIRNENNELALLDFGHSQLLDIISDKHIGTNEYRPPEI